MCIRHECESAVGSNKISVMDSSRDRPRPISLAERVNYLVPSAAHLPSGVYWARVVRGYRGQGCGGGPCSCADVACV